MGKKVQRPQTCVEVWQKRSILCLRPAMFIPWIRSYSEAAAFVFINNNNSRVLPGKKFFLGNTNLEVTWHNPNWWNGLQWQGWVSPALSGKPSNIEHFDTINSGIRIGPAHQGGNGSVRVETELVQWPQSQSF